MLDYVSITFFHGFDGLGTVQLYESFYRKDLYSQQSLTMGQAMWRGFQGGTSLASSAIGVSSGLASWAKGFKLPVAPGTGLSYQQFRSINAGRYNQAGRRAAWRQYRGGVAGDYLTRSPGMLRRLSRVVYDNRSWNYVASQRNRGLVTHRGRDWTWEHMFLKQRYVNQSVPSLRRGFTNGYFNTMMRITRSQNSHIRGARADRLFKARLFGGSGAAGVGGYLLGDELGDYYFED